MDSDTCFDNFKQYSCVPPFSRYQYAMGIRPIEFFDGIYNMELTGIRQEIPKKNSSVLMCKKVSDNVYKCSKSDIPIEKYNKIALPNKNNERSLFYVRENDSIYKPKRTLCKKLTN